MFIFLAMGVTAFIMLLFFRSFSAMFYSMLVVGVGVFGLLVPCALRV